MIILAVLRVVGEDSHLMYYQRAAGYNPRGLSLSPLVVGASLGKTEG